MRFFVGMHHPQHAARVGDCCISVNVLRVRRGPFAARDWILDSGAFSELATHGRYRHPVSEYAGEIERWRRVGNLLAVVAQDYMCEPWIVAKTGLTVAEHQRLTVERYAELREQVRPGVYVMPVIQGFAPDDYRRHLELYGDTIAPGAWVGVGSVCKRNGKPEAIASVLCAIDRERPDLRLHGFGVKFTALGSPVVRSMLYSSDSMAWSFWARRHGRDANSWREAKAYARRVARLEKGA